jgi:hypothetical protein
MRPGHSVAGFKITSGPAQRQSVLRLIQALPAL